MTPSSELSHLMTLDALGEATPEQQAELRRLLAEQPGMVAEHTALKNMAAGMDGAASRNAAALPVPDQVVQRLEQARLAALSQADRAQVTAESNVIPKGAKGGPRPRSTLAVLAWAALIALLVVPTVMWLMPHQTTAVATANPALAPRGETGMTQPTLVWDNTPGQQYDVWILPEGGNQRSAPALFVANKVRSPLEFAALQPGPANPDKSVSLKAGTSYLALVCLAGKGRLAGVTVSFRTSAAAIGAPPSPSDPATALALVHQLLEKNRPGDALMVLKGMPEEVRQKPEAVRVEADVRKALHAPGS